MCFSWTAFGSGPVFPVPGLGGHGALEAVLGAVGGQPLIGGGAGAADVDVHGDAALVVGVAGLGGEVAGAVEVLAVEILLLGHGAEAAVDVQVDAGAGRRGVHAVEGGRRVRAHLLAVGNLGQVVLTGGAIDVAGDDTAAAGSGGGAGAAAHLDAELVPRLGADDAVGGEAVGALEGLHGRFRLGAEGAVRGAHAVAEGVGAGVGGVVGGGEGGGVGGVGQQRAGAAGGRAHAVEGAPRLGADDAVGGEAARLLEGLHRGARLGAEGAIHRAGVEAG